MKPSLTAVVLTIMTAMASTSGCASINPAGYDSFDGWLVGEPGRDYRIDPHAEDRPQLYRMFYGLLYTPPLVARDVGKLAAAPAVGGYFLVEELRD